MSVFVLEDFGDTVGREAMRLDRAAPAAEEMEGVLLEIAFNMMKVEEKLFSSGGRSGGGSWKKLKDDTIKRKGHATILVKTGELKASLTEPEATHQILNITGNVLQFGTSDPIAQVHDEGWGTVPQRPLFKFRDYDYERWRRMIAAHLMRAFR